MTAKQQVFRVRRKYNQWVVNQTLEDYALRFTAKKARRWSIERVALTALGTTAFLALEALGGVATLEYGFTNAVAAMAATCIAIFLVGLPICNYAARYGVDIDLLTRGAGFGYLGSTVTSLVYASFTFIFFAIEAAILAVALQALFNIPISIGYVICAVAVIPIVTHGFTFISRFQVGTQYLWLLLQVSALILIGVNDYQSMPDWAAFEGKKAQTSEFNLGMFGAASAILFALIAQLGEQVDYLRFMPEPTKKTKLKWQFAVIMAGPGWVITGFIKMLFGSFLAYLAFSAGASAITAADPTHMYEYSYRHITDAPHFALIIAGVMVIISQMKINVTNAYAGSIAWSNFFSRLTHSHPGRVVWLVFNVVIALVLMELGIYRVLESILGVFAIVAVAWLSSISADLSINKKLGLSPKGIDFKRAHLYDINPVGVGSMAIGSIIGIFAYLEYFGPTAKALAHFITLGSCFITVPLIAWWTKGRYYLARTSDDLLDTKEIHECCICENEFEREDTAYCTAYSGAICSLCCTLDARCMDSCKPDARFSEQLHRLVKRFAPAPLVKLLFSRVGQFISIFTLTCLVSAGLLSLVYFENASRTGNAEVIADTLTSLYFILIIIFGVLIWLFLLASESRVFAQKETDRQTKRLLEEIEAHNQTDIELQRAKEVAESANNAKSRYLSGISHEFRTPLQAILGYAQLLRKDPSIPEKRRKSIDIIHRSSEHLADLIEGLLDVSRIEAGRIELRLHSFNLHDLLNQMQQIFSPDAAAKGIGFKFTIDSSIPKFVKADEKRLRQILTNLISNAIKFTQKGQVEFSARYRSQVAEFRIADTGPGIPKSERKTIFKPFERLPHPTAPATPGTGLGLTIVSLLSEIMGGDISLESVEGEGSIFTLSLMLSSIRTPTVIENELPTINGYLGDRKKLMVVDDEPLHRGLISDMLLPLGFHILEARDASSCLRQIEQSQPDLFLLDVSMPGISGLELAKELREKGCLQPIIMVSADAAEPSDIDAPTRAYTNYMVKPIRLNALLEKIRSGLEIEWLLGTDNFYAAPLESSGSLPQNLDKRAAEALLKFAEIGYTKGILTTLAELQNQGLIEAALAKQIIGMAEAIQFPEIVALIKRSTSYSPSNTNTTPES